MARVIAFYVPDRLREGRLCITPEQRGKVIAFPSKIIRSDLAVERCEAAHCPAYEDNEQPQNSHCTALVLHRPRLKGTASGHHVGAVLRPCTTKPLPRNRLEGVSNEKEKHICL
jgi:hypothetical protein